MRRDRLSYFKDFVIHGSLWLSTTLSAGFCVTAVMDTAEENATEENIGMLAGGAAGWLISLGLAKYYRRNDAMWQQEKPIEIMALEISKGIVGNSVIFDFHKGNSPPVIIPVITGALLSLTQFVELKNGCDFSIVPFLEHRQLQSASNMEIMSWLLDRLLEISAVFIQNLKLDLLWIVLLNVLVICLLMRKILLSWTLWYTPLEIFGDAASGLERERFFTRNFLKTSFYKSFFGICKNSNTLSINDNEARIHTGTQAGDFNIYGILMRRGLISIGTGYLAAVIQATIKFFNDELYDQLFSASDYLVITVTGTAMAIVCYIVFFSHELGRGRPRGSYQPSTLPISSNAQALLSYQPSDHLETKDNPGIQNDDHNDQNYSAPTLISTVVN